MIQILARVLSVTLPLWLYACAVGPNYHRPAAPASAAYREDQGWKPATPALASSDAAWWSVYGDPELDALEKQIEVSNQTLKAAEANYRAARAAVGIDRGALLPTITASAAGTRSGGNSNFSSSQATAGGTQITNSGSSGRRDSYSAAVNADWQIDLWGRIRRTVEGDVARAQASAADVAAARLSAQTTLAEDYFQLRAADRQSQLLNDSVDAFKASLQIAQNRVNAGVATLADVYTARTELENTQAQATSVQLTRARLVHAIAVLTGRSPSEFAMQTGTLAVDVPVIPAGVPSGLLERRPDIGASERSVAAANAAIGVAAAAWFPSLTLSGSYGFASSTLPTLLRASNSLWSFGPQLAETLFNGGTRVAQNQQARANYDAAVATYRETVLSAFQQVEDNLASLRVLQQQAALQDTAVTDARRSEELTLNQYKAGVADYSSVITAQTTRLNSEISALGIQSQRLVASVDLITALGGGWSAGQLPR